MRKLLDGLLLGEYYWSSEGKSLLLGSGYGTIKMTFRMILASVFTWCVGLVGWMSSRRTVRDWQITSSSTCSVINIQIELQNSDKTRHLWCQHMYWSTDFAVNLVLLALQPTIHCPLTTTVPDLDSGKLHICLLNLYIILTCAYIYRCVPCNFDSTSADFTQHLRTTTHARAVATRPSVSSSSESSSVSTVNHVSDPENDNSAVVDITNSPPSVDIADSPPRVEIPETSRFQPPKPTPFRQPILPAGITMRPVSPTESIMEVTQSRSFNKLPTRQRPRIPSPTESIMEVEPTRAPSPTPSIMEIDTIPDSHQMNTPVDDPIQPVRARLVSNHRMRSPLTQTVNSNHRTQSPSIRNSRMNNSPAAIVVTPSPGTSRQRLVNVAPPPKFSNFKVSQPKPSTSMGRPQAGRVSSGLTPLYSCGEPCKLSFSDTQKFQNHAIWHDSTKTYAKLDCHVCGWHIAGESVSDAVTMHLFNIKHTVNVAKKMSKSVK